jgi:hypothetical protein
MKYIFSLLLILTITDSIAQTNGSRRRSGQKKDTLTVLACPLNDATEPPPQKNAMSYGKDESITLLSTTDTLIKAGIGATVSQIQRNQEGKWDVVLYHDDYWIWYSGVSKVYVKEKQVLKTGDTIGFLPTGQEIRLLLFDFETPMDVKRLLDCKKVVK